MAIAVVSDDPDYERAIHAHLIVRGLACLVASGLILAGVAIYRPRVRAPWILLALVALSYTVRPLLTTTGYINSWNGWVVVLTVLAQRLLDVAAIVSLTMARRVERLTDSRLEVAMVLCAYLIIAFYLAALPGWRGFDRIHLAVAFGVVIPICYVVTAVLVKRMVFIDVPRGLAFQLVLVGFVLNILFDVVGFSTFELGRSPLGAAIFDVYTLSAFCWAAACLHPSMHLVTEPATEVRPKWSLMRSLAIIVAAVTPLISLAFGVDDVFHKHEAVVIAAFAITLLLFWKARRANAADAESRLELIEQSHTDGMTGLLNRRGILNFALGMRDPIGAVFVDLDDFRLVNDVHGHTYADAVLDEVANRLRALAAPIAAVARVGGDDFLILFANTAPDSVDRARAELEGVFQQPFLIDGAEVRVTASMGIATEEVRTAHPAATTSGVRGAEEAAAKRAEQLYALTRKADTAQYYAKQKERATTRLFNDQMLAERVRQKHIQDLVSQPERDGLFWLSYQAIVRLSDGQVVGAESLLRLRSPELGNVSPAEFIPVAERIGAIQGLGAWVFTTLRDQLAAVVDRLPPDFLVSVNVSPRQLDTDSLLDLARRTAVETPAVARRIRIEITESDIVGTERLGRIRALREAGYSIAVDDFGSEYASLQYLARISADVLKLDKSFTDQLEAEPASRTIVAHVIDMAAEMKMKVIAEGIETEAERDILAGMGCQFGQGYLWDRPSREFDRFLTPVS